MQPSAATPGLLKSTDKRVYRQLHDISGLPPSVRDDCPRGVRLRERSSYPGRPSIEKPFDVLSLHPFVKADGLSGVGVKSLISSKDRLRLIF